jgi:hypothetical protein
MIRNAPGPFRGARALTADFIDGLIDVVSPPVDAEQPPPPMRDDADHVSATNRDEGPPRKTSDDAKKSKAAASGPKTSDLQGAFKKSLGRTDWVRRQDFKVLAIFWEANRQELEALTAKKASKLGSDIGLTIRHENIRKVVRTRLTDKIETSTVPDSQPPTFQYKMTNAGKTFFEKEYLSKV